MAAQRRGSVKGLGPAGGRLVACDRDGVLLLPLSQRLEHQFRAAVELPDGLTRPVAGDGLGEDLVVGVSTSSLTTFVPREYLTR